MKSRRFSTKSKKTGSAEDNPETAGPSENLREEALEEINKENTE